MKDPIESGGTCPFRGTRIGGAIGDAPNLKEEKGVRSCDLHGRISRGKLASWPDHSGSNLKALSSM